MLDTYYFLFLYLGEMRKKGKILKSMSFKNRDEMVKGLESIKVKCGMDALVEKLHKSRMGLIEDEAEYLEMKAELHYGI